MDNISSTSSVDDLELDSVLDQVDKLQKAAKPDGMDQFVAEWDQRETAKVQAAARWSRQYDPDAYAKAEKLGMGIDPERGLRQMELLENQAAITAYGEVFAKAPQMKAYFAEKPKQLAKARPDELDNISGLEWISRAIPEAWKETETSIQAAYAANRIARGQGTIYDRALVENFDGGRTFGADGWFDKALIGGTQTVLPIWETLKGSMRGSVLGGGSGAIVGSAVPGLGTAAGAVTGATYGFIGGGYIQAWELNTGLNLLDFNKYRSEDGKPLDPQVAYTAARISGAMGAMLDAVGIGPIMKTVPGAGQLVQRLSKEGMKEALKNPTFRQALYNFAKNTGEQVATETATEVLQQGVQVIAGELAKANSEGQWDFKSPEEIASEMADAGVQALQVMSLFAPFISSTRFGADLIEINRSKRNQDALNRVISQVQDNPLIQRDPNLAQELIDRQLEDKKLYIPSQELVQYFQENNLDRYGPALPNWRQRLDQALATGDDVEVSVGEFVAHLSKDPKDNPLLALVRTDPGGYTQAEIQAYSEALDKVLLSETEKAQKAGAIPSQAQVRIDNEILPEIKQLRTQIVNAGFKNEAADQYATMFDAFFKTLAQRTGKSPSELFQEFGVEVQRGLLPDVEQGSQASTIFADKLGAINVAPAGQTSVISLFDGHDMSTLLHESGHFFLNTLHQVKKVDPELIADWEAIRSKFKIEGDTITREQHEEFARSIESYFFSGKSPDPKLRPMFEQFRRWLKQIYQSIRKLGGSVDPEIAKVFDRMFVTDERLARVALDTAYAPIFDAAEAMGISPEEYLAYANLVDELKVEAQDTARERIVGQAARLAKGWRGEIQKQLRIEAEAKLKETPPYNHIAELKQGKIKIDKAQLEKYSKEAGKKFPRESLAKDGLDLDLVAELFKYPSADEMVYDFTQALPLKEAAKQLAEQEMVARYGENFDDSAVMDLAVKEQFAQDARLTVLGTELKALSRKSGKEISDFGPKQLARELARASVYAKTVKELDSYKINNQVHRASAMAQSAIVKGDWAAAADWKRKQLMAQAVANETETVLKTVAKIRDKAARYTRTASKSIDPSYMEQIRALVENYDFAKISGKKLNKRISLREFLDKAAADGEVTIQVPDRLLRDAGKVSYKELSAEDLLGLGDTLDNLEHLGRMKQKLRKAKELREFGQVKEEILTSLKKLPARKVKMKTYTKEQRSLMDMAIDFHAALIKPEQMIEFLDSGNIKGPMMEHIFQPLTDALAAQNELSAEYNKKIMDVFESIPANYLTETVTIPGLQEKMTREEIYAVALNTGNASSRKKLLEGELWSEQQLAVILAHMTKEDWDRVQKVWDVLNTLWPKIAQLEKRLTGVAPPKVEGREFSTPFGDYKGGYYPVVYDFKTRRGRALIEDITPVDKRFANGLFSDDYIRPGTSHKYTVKRTKTAKPIQLSLGILPAHVQTVIHDLTHREAIKDAYKLLWDPEVQRAIEDAEGHDAYVNLQNWLKAIATERHVDADPVSKRIQHLRTGMTIYGLGYRFTTVAAQALGLFPSATRVPLKHLANAAYQMAKHPVATWNFVEQSSVEMKHRMNQQDRDIRAAVADLTKKKGVVDWFKLHAFTFIGYMDAFISKLTWIGAYTDYIERNPTDRDIAIRHADRTVRLTQGTGNVKDMAQIMNSKNELNRLFTMFYSGFSAQYNLQVDLYRKTKRDISEGDWRTIALERLPQWLYLVVMPAVIGAWIAGDAPEDDESAAAWAAKKALLYPTASIPFVRDITGAIDSGFGYKMSPVARVGESSVKAIGELLDIPDSEKDFEMRKFAKPAAEVSSIILQLPTGQAISTIDNLWKGLEEGDLEARDLIYRRRDK